MINKLLFLFIFMFSVSLFAQNEINQLDSQGEKHGAWIVKHKNGKVKHETIFDHGIPTGKSVRYDTKGKKNVRNDFVQ